MALSARHREHGLAPSHLGRQLRWTMIVASIIMTHTLDFFKRQRSQALQTLLRTLSECEWSEFGVDWRAAMIVTGRVCVFRGRDEGGGRRRRGV